jgi:hypothetical protein
MEYPILIIRNGKILSRNTPENCFALGNALGLSVVFQNWILLDVQPVQSSSRLHRTD